MQSQLLTCAAGCQRVVLDAALSPVQSRLLTCAAGVVDAPVSNRSSYSSCNPVLGWGLRNCRLSESCLSRSSLSCAVSAANLRCWLSESCLRRCSLSPVQSRLLTCAAGVVDAPVSNRSSYSSCNPVLGWGLRNCRLSESCLNAALSPVQSRLLTCAAGLVDAPVCIVVATRSWGEVYVIAGFMEC